MGSNIDFRMISIAVVIALIIGAGAGYMVGNSPVSSLMEERDQLEAEYHSSSLAVQSLEAELNSTQELLAEGQRNWELFRERYLELISIEQENQELNQQIIGLEWEITDLQNAYQYMFDEYEELHDYYMELEENYTVLQAAFEEINQSYASLLSSRARARKSSFARGEIVAFNFESIFPQPGSYIEIYDPYGTLYWITEAFVDSWWFLVDGLYTVPYYRQTAGGNPMIFAPDAPLGTWSWEWYDNDDNELDSGTFTVTP